MEEILQGSEEDSYFLPSCLETLAKKFFFFDPWVLVQVS